jgi:predicted nicotinamide N-methyase
MKHKTCEYILHHILPPVHRACHLVPELTLSILTSSHPLWHIPYEEAMAKLDRSDPWWIFLWPGSQALSRYVLYFFTYKTLNVVNSYLLDNSSLVRGRRALDVGCGCGASAIAAKMAGAINVIANDIDQGKHILDIFNIILHTIIFLRCSDCDLS